MEFAFGALQHLCGPMLDRLGALPRSRTVAPERRGAPLSRMPAGIPGPRSLADERTTRAHAWVKPTPAQASAGGMVRDRSAERAATEPRAGLLRRDDERERSVGRMVTAARE